jgi:hypothetical protein
MSNLHTIEEARAAKARVMEVFAALAPVVGVGITRIGGGYGVKVNLRETPAPDTALPEAVDGVPVRVEVVGTIHKR